MTREGDVIEPQEIDVDAWWQGICAQNTSYARRAKEVYNAITSNTGIFSAVSMRRHLAKVFIEEASRAHKPYKGRIDAYFYGKLMDLAPDELKALTLKMTSSL